MYTSVAYQRRQQDRVLFATTAVTKTSAQRSLFSRRREISELRDSVSAHCFLLFETPQDAVMIKRELLMLNIDPRCVDDQNRL